MNISIKIKFRFASQGLDKDKSINLKKVTPVNIEKDTELMLDVYNKISSTVELIQFDPLSEQKTAIGKELLIQRTFSECISIAELLLQNRWTLVFESSEGKTVALTELNDPTERLIREYLNA